MKSFKEEFGQIMEDTMDCNGDPSQFLMEDDGDDSVLIYDGKSEYELPDSYGGMKVDTTLLFKSSIEKNDNNIVNCLVDIGKQAITYFEEILKISREAVDSDISEADGVAKFKKELNLLMSRMETYEDLRDIISEKLDTLDDLVEEFSEDGDKGEIKDKISLLEEAVRRLNKLIEDFSSSSSATV